MYVRSSYFVGLLSGKTSILPCCNLVKLCLLTKSAQMSSEVVGSFSLGYFEVELLFYSVQNGLINTKHTYTEQKERELKIIDEVILYAG